MADEKIKCFTENVTPVKKVDIEFICADNGAHDSIREALQNSMFKDVRCGERDQNGNLPEGAIDCEAMENTLKDNMGGIAHTSIGPNVNTVEDSNYTEGVADFNGNYQMPNSEENYVLINMRIKENAIYRYLGV